eukprot:TRINITY_DN8290_c0_g1_i4.p1 TRINITY_DN8290_c0_g1~~TRINITY_DN8290_c0_g1_i4.p1  ORF type:complete len:232 (-),score=30.32 TRINITY_DN8290_c0_g1_i4:458-1153(-)
MADNSPSVAALEDLLDLYECGMTVTWPRGHCPASAKKVVAAARRKAGSQSISTSSACTGETKEPAAVASEATPAVSSAATGAGAADCDGTKVFVEAFRCPITMMLMKDPTMTPSGNSYDGDAIRKVVEDFGFSPLTKRRLRRSDLIPNRALADAIMQTRFKEGAASEDSSTNAAQSSSMSGESRSAPGTPPAKRTRTLRHQLSAPKEPPPLPPAVRRMVAATRAARAKPGQ